MQPIFVFLSDLVLLLSLVTLSFAAAACTALMLRKRMPLRRRRAGAMPDTSLLRRYVPRDED